MNKHTLRGTEYDTYRATNPSGAPIRYARGRKVLVDFGYGIDRELFQPHPAIVLDDFGKLLVVVPTNTDDGNVYPSDVKKAIIRIPSDHGRLSGKHPIFPKDTIINLHQIRHVSKNRIQKDLHCNVKNYIVPNDVIDELNRYLPYPVLQYGDDLMQVLMVKLAHLYSPDLLYQIKRLTDQVNDLTFQLSLLTDQLESLKQIAAGLEAQDQSAHT